MARVSSVMMAFGLGCFLLAAPSAQAEPRPGTVVGLDLASPEKAAESFVRAWAAGDYFVAYLALDPELRFRFYEMYSRFDFRGIHGENGPPLDAQREVVLHNTAESSVPGRAPGLVIDAFAEFDGQMRTAQQFFRLALILLPSAADGAQAVISDEGDQKVARVPISAAAGGGTLVLRASPGGRWRVLGIEGRNLPELWAYPAR